MVHWTIGTTRQIGFCKWSNGPSARFTPFTGCKSLYALPNLRALVDHLQPFTAIGNSLIVNGIYSEMLSTSVNGVNRANGPLDHLQSVDCQWQ